MDLAELDNIKRNYKRHLKRLIFGDWGGKRSDRINLNTLFILQLNQKDIKFPNFEKSWNKLLNKEDLETLKKITVQMRNIF